MHIRGLIPLFVFYFRVEENFAGGKFREIPCAVDINVWNKLSTDCVHATSVNMFKNKIDKYLAKAGYI